MVLIPMFLLVSFAFESLPLPVLTRLLKAVILDFFSYAGESAPPLYKNSYFNFLGSGLSIKPGWKHKKKKESK